MMEDTTAAHRSQTDDDAQYADSRYETLATERHRSVLLVRLNRPQRLNGVNMLMTEELLELFDDIDGDADVRAVVMTGAGRAFCAGADFSDSGAATFAFSGADHRDTAGEVNLRLFNLTKPIIAAINGPAVGMGATLTLPMDVRIAADSARIGFVFGRRGVVTDGCASWFLPRIVGISQALRWTLDAQVFDAAEALKAGLVSEVLPAPDLLPRALEIAHEIADNTSSVSAALNRQLLWRMLGADHPIDANRVESRILGSIGGSPDVREGVESFLEKRPAAFPGRVPADLPDCYPWWPDRPFVPLS